MTQPTPSATDLPLGAQMAQAIATRDEAALRALFSTPVRFCGVTPRRFWDAETPVGVADIILGTWFSPDKSISGVISIDTDTVADVEKVSYCLSVDLESGPSVIEQVAYYTGLDGQVVDLWLVCSGFRPL